MRVLQIISKFYQSGAENLVYNLSPLFQVKGHHVTVLALYYSENKKEEQDIQERLNQQGIATIILGNKNKKISLLYKLHKFIKDNRFDVIHSHAFQPNFYGRLASLFTNTPVVVTYHSASNDWFSTKSQVVEKLVDPFSAARVTVSQIPLDFYRKKISKKNDVHCIPNGIELINVTESISNKDKIKKELGVKPDGIFLLNIGRIVEQKGHLYLINALDILKKQGINNLYLAIAGHLQDQRILTVINSKIIEFGLQDRVFVLGSRSDVNDLLFASDYFVFPSIAEAHPIALIEAANAGKPIIASAIEANVLAFGNESIFYVPEQNDKELAAMILHAIQNPLKAQEKANNAKIEARNKYDIRCTADNYEELYERIKCNSL